ncbi:MAG: hypothetical protein JNG88_05500 [Phycisphaerales bacterium]|nr:hypothetical protein [Phycisphaerales bacterium]
MVQLEHIAQAALNGDALAVRSLAHQWLHETTEFQSVPKPQSDDHTLLAVAASMIELFAERRGAAPPDWARGIEALDAPLFLVRSAATMRNLKRLCEEESPEPMRRRRIFVPPNYLFAA